MGLCNCLTKCCLPSGLLRKYSSRMRNRKIVLLLLGLDNSGKSSTANGLIQGGPEECRKGWASIRDQFRRTLQKRKTKSGQATAKYKSTNTKKCWNIVDRETLTNMPSLEDKRDDSEFDPRMEEPELNPESEPESQNEVSQYPGTCSQTIVQSTSPIPPAGSTQATPGKSTTLLGQ